MPAPVAGILFLLATLLLAARHLTGGRADLSHGVCGASATFVPKRPCAACGRNFMNVVEPILFQAKHNPPAPAMCAPGTALGIVSYARLARFIHSVGHRAVRLGVAPRQVVAIHVDDHIFHAALALGLMHIGVATVSIGTTLSPGLRADVILTDKPEAFANERGAKIVAVDLSWMSGKGVPVDERHIYRGNGNAICRIALTSGSTGEPQAIGFTHNNQLARLARYNHVFGNLFPIYSRFFSDYGLGSSGGFRHILYVLSRGGTMFFPGPSPMETLQTFALYKIQGLIASPGGLSSFLTFYDTNRDFPCSLDIILSAGSPLPDSLSQQVRARMCSNLIFYYGTSETSTIASAPAHALTGLAGAVGYVTPDVSVQVVDDKGDSVPANQEGSVRVRTPVSVHGYLDDTERAKTAFRDGYFDTRDIGFLSDENILVISGRKKDVLNLGGDKVSPRIIEDALRAFYGIRDAAAFSVANGLGIDEVWAIVVPKGRLNEEGLQKHCRERLARTHVPARFINVGDIPRNANGKVDRDRLNAIVQGFTASSA